MQYLFLGIGLGLVLLGAHCLVEGASALARRLRIPDLIIGLTIVAFGTSAPELVVNVESVAQNSSELAVTNILGSCIINILLILGVSALICPIACRKSTLYFEMPANIFASLLVLVLMLFPLTAVNAPGGIYLTDGIILLSCFMLFYGWVMHQQMRHSTPEEQQQPAKKMNILLTLLLVVAGLGALIYGGDMMVENAICIAKHLGVSQALIGVTIVALGTSLPELATSVYAAARHNTDLAIGNIIGSNIFNIFLILGVSACGNRLDYYPQFGIDILFTILSGILIWLLVALNKQRTLTRWGGAILVAAYIVYTAWIIYRI